MKTTSEVPSMPEMMRFQLYKNRQHLVQLGLVTEEQPSVAEVKL
jgi:hypothetical protein